MSRLRKKSNRFRAKMAVAAIATIRCGTLEEAAQAVEVSVSTLKRWHQEPTFARALRDAQREIFAETTSALRSAGKDCAAILAAIARDPKAPSPSRVRAALGVVGLLIKLNHLDGIESRLAEIENTLKQRGLNQ